MQALIRSLNYGSNIAFHVELYQILPLLRNTKVFFILNLSVVRDNKIVYVHNSEIYSVRWTGKFYNDGHPIEIPDFKENNSRNVKSIPPPIRYDDAQKEYDLMKQPLNEKNTNYK